MSSIRQKIVFAVFPLVTGLMFLWLSGAEARESSVGSLYNEAKASYYALKDSSARRADRSYWMECANKFLEVYDKFPQSSEAYKSIYTVARLFDRLFAISQQAEDRGRAMHFYYKLVSEYPDGRFTDDAMYYQGELALTRNDKRGALGHFNRVAQHYQNSEHIAKVYQRLRELQPESQKTASRIQAPSILHDIRYSVQPGFTRIVARVSGPVKWTHQRLNHPPRIYLNIPNSRLGEGFQRHLAVRGSVVSGIRSSQFDANTSRLVFDLQPVNGLKLITSRKGSELTIDLIETGTKTTREPVVRMVENPQPQATKTEVLQPLKILPVPEPSQIVQVEPTPIEKLLLPEVAAIKFASPRSKKLIAVKPKSFAVHEVARAAPQKSSAPKVAVQKKGQTTVVIDPGHGGKDLGAQSSTGLHEKKVNLAVSKRLRKILESQYNYRVVLTRDDDTFIPLDERGDVANDLDADLFVSVHANAAPRKSAHGIETYYLGTGHSAQAQQTAARENGELVHSVKDNQVQQILANLISTTKINDSAQLAGQVQDELYITMKRKNSHLKNLGVKEGPFFVLHDTNMPSILVEVGFLTNRREGRKLKDPKYLDQLALSIAKGIHRFLRDRRPTI
jgi:N-acetylmuramoyl-L-alanine amidase